MKSYDIAEQSYKNGYEKGFQAGYNKAVEEGQLRTSFWKWAPDGDKICAECGMLEPDCLPGACVIWPHEKRYCFYCGRKMINVEGS